MRKIEDEIQQSHFSSPEQKAHINIVYTAYYLSSRLEKKMKKYDINLAQFNILRIVKGQNGNPISIKDTQNRMIHKMANTSRIVHTLVEKELIHREISQTDKREVWITMTSKGEFILLQINEILDRFLLSQFSHITKEEIETLNTILDKIRY
ncbi:MarR family winged helix-turn-helix transcriptional regulator [Membranihabitans marinus]|uniref:MarR family winged helix-turn-helix transcriptional regulator n=1 Tax=Membranihabitans marinus TaxID=1227546 RepID=UPI001F02F138|nr:MarR family transcriptional regulator [Membranihabitans marinus]